MALHTSAPSVWYASELQIEKSWKNFHWRKLDASSDSNAMKHCSANASLGRRVTAVRRSRRYSSNRRSQCASTLGSQPEFDSRIAIFKLG